MSGALMLGGLDAIDYDYVVHEGEIPELPDVMLDDAAWAAMVARLPIAVSYEEALSAAVLNDDAAAHWLTTDSI